MKRKFTSHHGAVMVEPIIVLSFFAIISVFLLRMFASTEKVRSGAEKMSKAVIRAESAMEYVLGSAKMNGTPESIGFLNTNDGNAFVKYFDKNWEETQNDGAYAMTLEVEKEKTAAGEMLNYRVSITEVGNEKEIYELKAKKYMSGGSAE